LLFIAKGEKYSHNNDHCKPKPQRRIDWSNLPLSTLKITGLYIYPVKSMKGIALNLAQLTACAAFY